MANEVDENQLEEQDERKKKKNAMMKKVPMNHISADDIEFDDPEYVEARKRNEITGRRKVDAEVEKKQHDKANKKEPRQDIDIGQQEDEAEESEDSNDEEEEEDVTETFKDDKWIEELESICVKMNKKSIKVNDFDSLLKKIILKLDPGRHELNKDRLVVLTKKLVQFYQSLFRFKTPAKLTIDNDLVNLLTKHIYDLTFKYGNKSTKKEPSKYIAIFKELLSNLNSSYLALKTSERKFPQLDIVIFGFNFFFHKSSFKLKFEFVV
jgi:hypothetical protein